MNEVEKIKSQFFILATILLVIISITSFISNIIALIIFGSIMTVIECYLVIIFIKLIKAVKGGDEKEAGSSSHS